jgi:hypothetical protein
MALDQSFRSTVSHSLQSPDEAESGKDSRGSVKHDEFNAEVLGISLAQSTNHPALFTNDRKRILVIGA